RSGRRYGSVAPDSASTVTPSLQRRPKDAYCLLVLNNATSVNGGPFPALRSRPHALRPAGSSSRARITIFKSSQASFLLAGNRRRAAGWKVTATSRPSTSKNRPRLLVTLALGPKSRLAATAP